ncbi:MAG: porin family protein [Bacteroidota bacterium]
MRSILLTLISFFLFSSFCHSQIRLGLKFSPSLAFNRVENSGDNIFSSGGTGGRFSFGLVSDFQLSENYAFSSGLIYTPKRVGIEQNDDVEEFYRVQYLQFPLTLKLFTNEVAIDKKIYFQLGGIAEVLVNDEARDATNVIISDFRPFDFSVLLGAGIEYQIGTSNILFGGFTYSRGLINVVSQTSFDATDDIEVRNDLFSLDIGIKF